MDSSFFKELKVYSIRQMCCFFAINMSEISELASFPGQLLQKNPSLMSMEIWSCADLVSISPHQDVWALCTSHQSLCIYD